MINVNKIYIDKKFLISTLLYFSIKLKINKKLIIKNVLLIKTKMFFG